MKWLHEKPCSAIGRHIHFLWFSYLSITGNTPWKVFTIGLRVYRCVPIWEILERVLSLMENLLNLQVFINFWLGTRAHPSVYWQLVTYILTLREYWIFHVRILKLTRKGVYSWPQEKMGEFSPNDPISTKTSCAMLFKSRKRNSTVIPIP